VKRSLPRPDKRWRLDRHLFRPMKRLPPRFLRAGSSLILAAAFAGCAGQPGAAKTETPGAPATSAATVTPATATQLLAEVNRPGAKATLVNVWATWCVPCVKEMPEILKLERAYRDKGLRVLLVSADFDSSAPGEFLARRGVEFASFWKSGGDQEFIDTIDPRWSGALPATIVFDAEGHRRAFWEGSADYDRFEQAVLTAMDAKDSPSPATGGTR
jgi:thiol-disulfide isomerase/thioredoxin